MRWLLAGLLTLPVLELFVAIEIGRWLGALPTLGALLLIGILGAMIIRRQGAAAWRSLNSSLLGGRTPSREVADAAVLVFAGVLLIAPGFVTDVLAVLLLLPPTRPIARRPLERALLRAAANQAPLYGPGFTRPDVVEGEIIVIDDDPPSK